MEGNRCIYRGGGGGTDGGEQVRIRGGGHRWRGTGMYKGGAHMEVNRYIYRGGADGGEQVHIQGAQMEGNRYIYRGTDGGDKVRCRGGGQMEGDRYRYSGTSTDTGGTDGWEHEHDTMHGRTECSERGRAS